MKTIKYRCISLDSDRLFNWNHAFVIGEIYEGCEAFGYALELAGEDSGLAYFVPKECFERIKSDYITFSDIDKNPMLIYN